MNKSQTVFSLLKRIEWGGAIRLFLQICCQFEVKVSASIDDVQSLVNRVIVYVYDRPQSVEKYHGSQICHKGFGRNRVFGEGNEFLDKIVRSFVNRGQNKTYDGWDVPPGTGNKWFAPRRCQHFPAEAQLIVNECVVRYIDRKTFHS